MTTKNSIVRRIVLEFDDVDLTSLFTPLGDCAYKLGFKWRSITQERIVKCSKCKVEQKIGFSEKVKS